MPRYRQLVSIFHVSIALWSDTLSLRALIDLAGLDPTHSHDIGDRISARMPAARVFEFSYWSKDSDVDVDTWTLAPHWPSIAPILERLATRDHDDVIAKLSLGVNARGTGFTFDLEPEQVDLLSRARCGVSTDTYEANRERADLPDDYPFPEGGSLHRPRGWKRVRRRFNLAVRNLNPFGKVRRHQQKISTFDTV